MCSMWLNRHTQVVTHTATRNLCSLCKIIFVFLEFFVVTMKSERNPKYSSHMIWVISKGCLSISQWVHSVWFTLSQSRPWKLNLLQAPRYRNNKNALDDVICNVSLFNSYFVFFLFPTVPMSLFCIINCFVFTVDSGFKPCTLEIG